MRLWTLGQDTKGRGVGGWLVLLGLVALFVGLSLQTAAGPNTEYAIDWYNVESTGLYVEVTGSAHGTDTVGLPTQHNVEMDWGDDTIVTYSYAGYPGGNGTDTYVTGEPDSDWVTWNWSDDSHYTVTWAVYHTYTPVLSLDTGYIGQGHSQSVGKESDLSTFFLQIDFLDVLQSGLPADTDGTFHLSLIHI